MTQLEEDWSALLFGVRRSVRYHNYRRAFFDRLGNWTSFLTIISGGGVLVATNETVSNSALAMICGGMAGLLGAIDLVLEFSSKGRDHYDLSKRFIRLEQDMARAGPTPSQVQYQDCVNARLEIEADEPPVFRILDAWCHNELVRAMGRPEEQWKIGFWQGLLKQYLTFGLHNLKKIGP